VAGEESAVRAMLGSRPVARDGVLVVHSAFAGFSRAGLRAEGFCEALLAAMAGGTVLMPTMTWRTVTPAQPVFDELKTPSHTGVLTEVFRTGYATHRSLHPTHSAAGRGPLAPRLLSTHHEGTTPCAGNSPYGLMRDYDAHILMLGIGLEACTAVHHAEETMAPELYVRPMSDAENYDLVDRRGMTHRVKTRRHFRLPRDFPKFEPLLKGLGQLAEGRVGEGRWILFSARDLYRMLFAALVERKDATLTTPDATQG
jgi:aminoglycoside 3-N-acetyltransferase